MRVLIYTSSFSPRVGGLETYAGTVAVGLASLGDRVTVLTEVEGPYASHAPYELVRRPRLGALIAELRRCEVALVVGPCLVPMLLASSLGRPFVVGHHGYQAACPNGLLLRRPGGGGRVPCGGEFLAHRYRSCVACMTRESGWRGPVGVLSTGLRRALCRMGESFAVSRHVLRRLDLPGQVVWHGVANTAPLSRREPDGQLRLAFVGRLVPEKGVPILLEATARLRQRGLDARLTVIGDGPEQAGLARLGQELGLGASLRLAGTLTGEVLERTLAGEDAVVVPSIWEEAAGLVAMEHMARGGVVVVSATGGLPELVGEAGLTFPVGDVAALTTVLIRLWEDRGLAVTLGDRARARAAELFGVERMVLEHRRILLHAAGGGRS